MKVLRANFPGVPDYILVSFLAAANRNTERTVLNIRRAIQANQLGVLLQFNQLPVGVAHVPPKKPQRPYFNQHNMPGFYPNAQQVQVQIERDQYDGSDDDHLAEDFFRNRGFFGGVRRQEPALFQPNETMKPTPRMRQRTCQIKDVQYTLPVIPEQAIKLVENALKVSPNMDFARVSAYLEVVIQTDKYPDDIVDRLLLAAADQKQAPSPCFSSDCRAVLQNIFVNFPSTTIGPFSNFKRVLTTFDNLTKNPPGTIMKKPRKHMNMVTVTDLFVAFDLCQLEMREIDKKQKEDAVIKEKKDIEDARQDGSLIECGCCFSEVPIGRCLQCPEGHLFCKSCVMTMIETTISEGRSTIKCPAMDGCGMDIPLSELKRAIPEKTLQRLFQTEAMNEIARSGLDHLVTCSNCGFIVEFLGSGNMRCPYCQKETCSKCGLPVHQNQTCEEAKSVDPEKLVEEKMNDAIIRVCPNCKTPFTKDEGCNKMVCPRCETWICYWCRKVIPKNVGYDHFWRQAGPCPPDKCPLWVENKQLHQIEAAKAKLKASGQIGADEGI